MFVTACLACTALQRCHKPLGSQVHCRSWASPRLRAMADTCRIQFSCTACHACTATQLRDPYCAPTLRQLAGSLLPLHSYMTHIVRLAASGLHDPNVHSTCDSLLPLHGYMTATVRSTCDSLLLLHSYMTSIVRLTWDSLQAASRLHDPYSALTLRQLAGSLLQFHGYMTLFVCSTCDSLQAASRLHDPYCALNM